jgi:hypothetical protein
VSGSLDVDSFLQRKRWGENWRSSIWAVHLALCAHLVRDKIDEQLYVRVLELLAFEADRFIDVVPPDGCLEENAFDTASLAWAICLQPDHAHQTPWLSALHLWSQNIATTVYDAADHSELFGTSVSAMVCTRTMHPDLTAENHGFFDPELLSYGSWLVLSLAAFRLCGKEVPAFFMRATHQGAFDLLLRFYLPNGTIYNPCGVDLPYFFPRPFSLAWGLWNNDPRAMSLTVKQLSWIDQTLTAQDTTTTPWIPGFTPTFDGWELLFQSQVGLELAMLAILPFPKELRFFSSGQIESAVDTQQIYPFVEVCYRRNIRTTRSMAWKAIGNHPFVGLSIHNYPELIAPHKANMLGIPSGGDQTRSCNVAFHYDNLIKDGFDTFGRMHYLDAHGNKTLQRDIRVITWGEEGLLLFDQITALSPVSFTDQFFSTIYLVNDHWTRNSLSLCSGSIQETLTSQSGARREIPCPAHWVSVEKTLLVQLIWERTTGLVYVPSAQRNAPSYWKNCALDMLGVRIEAARAQADQTVYRCGLYIGDGKGPRAIKVSGTAGEFFKGLVVMDGRNTLGL